MGLRQAFKGIGLAAAIVGLGAGLAIPAGGCGVDRGKSSGSTSAKSTETLAKPPLPAVDLAAPKDFQTATFAFG